MVLLSVDDRKIGPSFLFTLIQTEYMQTQFEQIASGCAQPQLPIRSLVEIVIPLPPLDIQRRIVAELEAERALVDANRELIARMEAKIKAKLAEVWEEEATDAV
jgi:type I restriction enzyme M protein